MPKTPPPAEPPEPAKKPAGYTQPPAGEYQPPAGEYQPPARGGTLTTPTTGSAAGGCGDRSRLMFPSFEGLEGIQANNLRTIGDAYYVGMFECVGAFRAIDELVARFVGGLNLNSDSLRGGLCNYMRQEPLRVGLAESHRVLSLFGDATLERLLLRLADAVIALDLSVRPDSVALAPSALPEAAARLAGIAAIEDLALFLDREGGGGVDFVTNEVGNQLMEILYILNHEDLPCHVPGNDVDDVFSVIAGLLDDEKDRPTDWEARQMARKASAGRQIFVTIANHFDGPLDTPTPTAIATTFGPNDLDTIAGLVYEWWAAHGSMYIEGVDDAGADEEEADENRLKVLRLRNKAS